MASVPFKSPTVELGLLALYLRRKAAGEVSELIRQNEYRPYEPFFGRVPGRRLEWLSDSRHTMEPVAREVRLLLDRVRA